MNRVQLDVGAAIQERQAPPPTVGEQFAKTSLHQAIGEIGEVRVHRTGVSDASMRDWD